LAAVLQALEVSESTLERWRHLYGGMKAEEAKWLKELEDENRRPKQIVAEQALYSRMGQVCCAGELASSSRKG
jgi:putative transposase